MKIYIAGKITGEPIEECYWKFMEAQFDVEFKHKAQVVNPLRQKGVVFGISHQEAMKICFNALKGCDAIYMLRDWKESNGATIEHEKAKELGIKIIYQD